MFQYQTHGKKSWEENKKKNVAEKKYRKIETSSKFGQMLPFGFDWTPVP